MARRRYRVLRPDEQFGRGRFIGVVLSAALFDQVDRVAATTNGNLSRTVRTLLAEALTARERS